MGALSNARYRQIHEEKFREFLRGWLDMLTDKSWTGTAAELYAVWCEYDDVRAHREMRDLNARLRALSPNAKPHGPQFSWLPVGSGLSRMLMIHEQTVRDAGWRLTFTRTAARRTITFRRARKP